MKQRMRPLIVLALLCLLVTGCTSTLDQVGTWKTVDGDGKVTEEKYDLSAFTSVQIEGATVAPSLAGVGHGTVTKIHFLPGQQGITVRTDSNLQADFVPKVTGGKLVIEPPNRTRYRFEVLEIEIGCGDLQDIRLDGAVKCTAEGSLTSQDLSMDINGALSGTIPLDVKSLTMRIDGAVELTLQGTADSIDMTVNGGGIVMAEALKTADASIKISGAGKGELSVTDKLVGRIDGAGTILASKTATKAVEITINGAGTCEVNAVDTLKANISGLGFVTYLGDPQIDKTINGAGSIKPMASK